MFPDLRCSLCSRPLLALFIGVEDQLAKNDLLSRRPRRLRRLPPPLSLQRPRQRNSSSSDQSSPCRSYRCNCCCPSPSPRSRACKGSCLRPLSPCRTEKEWCSIWPVCGELLISRELAISPHNEGKNRVTYQNALDLDLLAHPNYNQPPVKPARRKPVKIGEQRRMISHNNPVR
jgi:hypothetical protein